MWYVAQVNSGQEAAVRDMCKQMVDPAILQDAFLPEYETMRKIQGEWKRVRRMLFPGYLFMVTDSILALLSELKKVPATTRLLGRTARRMRSRLFLRRRKTGSLPSLMMPIVCA